MTAYVTVRLKIEIKDCPASLNPCGRCRELAQAEAEDICASADECTVLKVELE
jgi:hypothetical protein